MKNIEEIKKILMERKNELKDKYGVKEIGVFGSYVTETQTAKSDIDILIEFQKTVDLLTFVHIKHYLSDLIGAQVDLVMKKTLKPNIGKKILNQVIYI